MTRQSAAIAVFVKTPGLSPIKTRLSAGIGPELSAEFYRRSVAAIEATISAAAKSMGATPYWAVAEEAGLDDPLWQHFSRISQGNGKLGDRLHTVFDKLSKQYAAVVVIGADSPQLTPATLESAIRSQLDTPRQSTHVLGRTYDGGFYLFCSNRHISQQVWSAVPFSTANTAECLVANLRPLGQLKELARLTDVDEAKDLLKLKVELQAIASPTTEQVELLQWLEQNFSFSPLDASWQP